jgi:hypothetical protein
MTIAILRAWYYNHIDAGGLGAGRRYGVTKEKQAVSYNLRIIEVVWSGPERMPEGYLDTVKEKQRERSGKTSDGKSIEVKWFPDRPAHKDFPGSSTGCSKIFIDGVFYSVGAPYAIAFLERVPQAATFKIVEAV